MASFWKRLGEGPNRRYERQDKALAMVPVLIKDTNLDIGTISDLLKSYMNDGEIKPPKMLQENIQGPLAQNQMRETPTNSLRPPAYVFDETSSQFNRAPEGVSDPIRQIREVGRFQNNSTAPRGNWYMDENGQWKRWVGPDGASRPTSAQEKERLAIESALAQLKNKKANTEFGIKPITTRDEALDVPIGLGLDPDRYPEIKQALSIYQETPPEEPKQPGLWDDVKAFGRGTAEVIANTGRAIQGAAQRAAQPRPAVSPGSQTPVQPRKQDAMTPEQYLRSRRAKITPANIEWAKSKLGSK